MSKVSQLEPWLDKYQLAAFFGCGVRWIEYRVAEGLPSALIAGRRKFRVSEVEPWMQRHGHIQREAS